MWLCEKKPAIFIVNYNKLLQYRQLVGYWDAGWVDRYMKRIYMVSVPGSWHKAETILIFPE